MADSAAAVPGSARDRRPVWVGTDDGGQCAPSLNRVRRVADPPADQPLALTLFLGKGESARQWGMGAAVSAEFACRMADLLNLYTEVYDPARPTVCLDECRLQRRAALRRRLARA